MAPNRRRNKNYILATAALLIVVVAAIIAAGCTAGTSTPGAVIGLTGVSWSLDSYCDENSTLVGVLQGTEITARFDDGKVTGLAGCNQYGGDYQQNGTALSFSTLAQTLKYCEEPRGIMEQEARFMEVLGSTAGYRIENDRLLLTDAAGATVLVFTKEKPASIVGTSWTLAGLAGEDGGLVPVVPGTTVTAVFGADGRIGGSAGCNRYGANYAVHGADLMIEPTTMTEMYCGEPSGVMEQEDRYLALLAEVASCRVEGDRLILTDANGTDILVFEPIIRAPGLPLAGTDWVLDGYSTGKDAVSPVIAGTEITAMFAPDGKVAGSAGCNHYGGSYSLDGGNLSVSSLFSTLMYCGEPEGIMEQEGKYLALLANVSSYRVQGDRLTLTDAEGTDLLFFVMAEEVPPAPLAGTNWVLDTYSTGEDAVSSVIAKTTITVTFSPDGNIAGNAGCNNYGAAYRLDGTNLSVSPPVSTKMYCGEPEGIMEQEARYLTLLESVAGYRIDGNRLDLLDGAGGILLSFRADDADRS